MHTWLFCKHKIHIGFHFDFIVIEAHYINGCLNCMDDMILICTYYLCGRDQRRGNATLEKVRIRPIRNF